MKKRLSWKKNKNIIFQKTKKMDFKKCVALYSHKKLSNAFCGLFGYYLIECVKNYIKLSIGLFSCQGCGILLTRHI